MFTQTISRRDVIKFQLKKWWKPMFAILIPALCSLIFLWTPYVTENGKIVPVPLAPAAAYSILVMALYWVSECIPLSVTALLPLIIYPLFDVMDTEKVAAYYLGTSVMILLAGCIIALAFEYSNFHTRIALKVLLVVGSQIPRLLLGILLTAMFLSMWMNNTSTTAMMVPIVHVIMEEFEKAYMNQAVRAKNSRLRKELIAKLGGDANVADFDLEEFGLSESKSYVSVISKESGTSAAKSGSRTSKDSTADLSPEEIKAKKDIRDILIMFLLATAWGSNIGGTGVTVGTAPNVLAQAQLDKYLSQTRDTMISAEKCFNTATLSFLTWMQFAVFPMVLSLFATWMILFVYKRGVPSCLKCKGLWRRCGILKPQTESEIEEKLAAKEVSQEINRNIKKAIRAKYEQLGSMSLHEILVLVVFFIIVSLWVSGSVWTAYMEDVVTGRKKPEKIFMHDLVTGLLTATLLFIIPKDKKYYKNFFQGGFLDGIHDPLLNWHLVQVDIPWGPLVLIGGGTAISGGIKASKLDIWMGAFLSNNEALQTLQPWAFLSVILLITGVLTAIASNTATISMLIPVLLNLATQKRVHPFYMLVVPTIACSFAFMLPISTPPNAIVFDKSDMRQLEMAIPGFLVTVACNVILLICTHTVNNWMFGFDTYASVPGQAFCSPPKPVCTIIIPISLFMMFIREGTRDNTAKNHARDEKTQKIYAAAFTCFLMAFFWVTECLPLAITALFPVIFFPIFDIMSTENACQFYLGPSIVLLLAGCIVAQAFEYSNLHVRIALKVLLFMGAQIPRLLFGMCFTAMFLSMWMNNTSTTAMMVPIVSVIMDEFEKAYMNQAVKARKARVKKELLEHLGSEQAEIVILEMEAQQNAELQDPNNPIPDEQLSPEELKAKMKTRDLKIKFLLAVAWCSNIGGVGVSIGTAPNLIALQNLDSFRSNLGKSGGFEVKNQTACEKVLELGFLKWMKFCIVPMLLCTLATYIILLLAITGIPKKCPCKCNNSENTPELKKDTSRIVNSSITRAINAKYAQLGPMSLHEKLVLSLFLIIAFLWITGSELWWNLFENELVTEVETSSFIHDFVPGLFVCIFLFIIPKERKYYRHILRGSLYDGLKDPLLKWDMVNSELPWGPLIMIGGGGCISSGIKVSGLGETVQHFLQNNKFLSELPNYAFLITILCITALLTSIASNTAIISMLAPVLLELTKTKNVHPLYLVLVATISCSFAFLLPVSTPPNAIVFDKSDMKQKEMAIPGAVVTVVNNAILFGCVHIYADGMFELSEYAEKGRQYCSVVSH